MLVDNFGWTGRDFGGASPITGGGTLNFICKFTPSGTAIGNSQLYDNGVSVGINTITPDVSAKLDIVSTTQGFLAPRMTTAERNLIPAPATGLFIYNTSTNLFNYFDGVVWQAIDSTATSEWLLDGNSNGALRYIGTNDAFDFPIYTDGVERARFLASNGNLGIGTTTPLSILDISRNAVSSTIANISNTNASGSAVFNTVSDIAGGAIQSVGSTFPTVQFGSFLGSFLINSTSTTDNIIIASAKALGTGTILFGQYDGSSPANTWTERMRVHTNGNLGIGDTAPAEKLTVNGNVAPSVDATYSLGTLALRWTDLFLDSNIDYVTDLNFISGATTNVRFEATGNVGIATIAPTARLHVVGSTNDNTAFGFKADSLAGSNWFNVRNDGAINVFGGNGTDSTVGIRQRDFAYPTVIDIYNNSFGVLGFRFTDNGVGGHVSLSNATLDIDSYAGTVRLGGVSAGGTVRLAIDPIATGDVLSVRTFGGSGGFFVANNGTGDGTCYLQDSTGATTNLFLTSNGVSFIGGGALDLTATGGSGYLGIVAQGVNPTAPATIGLRFFADSTGAFSWSRNNGVTDTFIRTLDGTLTANRTYTLPDSNITFLGRTGVNSAGQVAYFSDANQVTTNTNFVFDSANGGLIVGGTALVAPANDVANFIRNQNAGTRFFIQNNSAGIGAYAQNTTSNGTYAISEGVFGTAYTGTAMGIVATNYTFLASNSVNGMMIYNTSATPILFGTNNVENIRILNGGAFLQGRTTVITSGDTAVFHRNQNDGSFVWASNNTSNTAGQSGFVATANLGTTNGALRALSAGFTTSGILVANACVLSTNSTVGLYMGSTSNTPIFFYTNNTEKISITADGRFYGTALHNNAGAVTGTTNQYVASGTYTPTLTNVANLDASTAYLCQWIRVGNVVTVSGKVDIDPTLTATSTQLGISLPIASNLATAQNCAGTAFASGIAGQGASILGDTVNDRAQLQYISGDITNQAMYFTFSYTIL